MTQRVNRRDFVMKALTYAGALGLGTIPVTQCTSSQTQKLPPLDSPRTQLKPDTSLVALVKGNDRRANMLRALDQILPQIKNGVKDKQVVIKPNFTRVKKDEWLASTHVDGVSALCEILSSFYQGKIIIAEGTGPGTPLQEALDSYEYTTLQQRYNVEFVDLRTDECLVAFILNEDLAPVPLRVSKLILDPNSYVVSAAALKTHNLAIATLGLKNIVMAAPRNVDGKEDDRIKMHSGAPESVPRTFNFNMFQMATHVTPDLVMIDGFVGMEGDGPIIGTPVESKLAIASTDWLAADRVGTEVMGFDFAHIGHLRYCAQAQMGEADLSRVQIVGEPIGNCKRNYKAPSSLESILI